MSLHIGNLSLGGGNPKIAVPLVGSNVDQLTIEVNRALSQHPDLIEWRIDYLTATNVDNILNVAQILHRLCQPTPVLATVRTQKEGGHFTGNDNEYGRLINSLIQQHCADLIDIELHRDIDVHQNTAHPIPLLYSVHYFDGTPSTDVMKQQLATMSDRGADILKIAVMPHSPSDVIRLLGLTNWANQNFKQPVVTMAMGKLGKISRISGAVFGSALTFASSQHSSAPGQLTVQETRQGINLLQLQNR